MIVVRAELHSAVTGKVSELGTLTIANDGTGTVTRGNYNARVSTRFGRVENYPRKSYSVWRLVARALLACYPEEPGKRNTKAGGTR